MKDSTKFWLLAFPFIASVLVYTGVLVWYVFTGSVPDWWCGGHFGDVNGTVTREQCEAEPFRWR